MADTTAKADPVRALLPGKKVNIRTSLESDESYAASGHYADGWNACRAAMEAALAQQAGAATPAGFMLVNSSGDRIGPIHSTESEAFAALRDYGTNRSVRSHKNVPSYAVVPLYRAPQPATIPEGSSVRKFADDAVRSVGLHDVQEVVRSYAELCARRALISAIAPAQHNRESAR